jgi:hypothetical protein
MKTQKKAAKAKPAVKFKDLESKKNPKGGPISGFSRQIEFLKNT